MMDLYDVLIMVSPRAFIVFTFFTFDRIKYCNWKKFRIPFFNWFTHFRGFESPKTCLYQIFVRLSVNEDILLICEKNIKNIGNIIFGRWSDKQRKLLTFNFMVQILGTMESRWIHFNCGTADLVRFQDNPSKYDKFRKGFFCSGL